MNEDWNGDYGDPRAAEYVLGILPAEERRAFADAVDRDLALSQAVDAWATRLAPLNAAYGEVTPPAAVKKALDRRLFSSASATAAPQQKGWRWWPFLVGQATGLAVAVLVLLALPFAGLSPFGPVGDLPQQTAGEGRMVASLAPNESDISFVALYEGETRQLNLTRVSGGAPAEGVYEIWVLHEGTDPVSLGLLPGEETARMTMPPAHARMMDATASLAISHEPSGGSPTGLPTGPVVSLGQIRNI